jgi:hypothetical protein
MGFTSKLLIVLKVQVQYAQKQNLEFPYSKLPLILS